MTAEVPRERFGVAVVGTGFVGPHHVDAIRRTGLGEVLTLVGSDKSRTKARAAALGIPATATDLATVLRDPRIDVVHVCTRNVSHVPLALEALGAGRHVMIEKPMAMDGAGARRVVTAARHAGRHVGVAFTYRGYPMVQRARQLIADGEIGDVRLVHGGYLQDWLSEPTDYSWRVDPATSGPSRSVADIGTHWFNVAEFVSGLQIMEVFADLATLVPIRYRPREAAATYRQSSGAVDEIPMETEDAAFIVVRFENGVHGACTISQVSPGRRNRLTLEISGSTRTVAWDHEFAPESLWIGSRDATTIRSRDVDDTRSGRGIDGLPPGLPEGWDEAFRNLFLEFYGAIAAGVSPAGPLPYPGVTEGLRAVSFVDAVLRSHRTRRWAPLKA